MNASLRTLFSAFLCLFFLHTISAQDSILINRIAKLKHEGIEAAKSRQHSSATSKINTLLSIGKKSSAKTNQLTNTAAADIYIALADFDKAIPLLLKTRLDESGYVKIGEAYEKSNQFENALSYYHKAMCSAYNNFSSKDVLKNPSFSKVSRNPKLASIALRKGRTLQKLYVRTKKNEYLIPSSQCFSLAALVIQKLLSGELNKDEREELDFLGQQFGDAALEATYNQIQLNNSIGIKSKIFNYLVLTKHIKTKLRQLELSEACTNCEDIKTTESPKSFSVTAIKSQLEEDEALLVYHCGTSKIYGLAITPKAITVLRKGHHQIQKNIKELMGLVKHESRLIENTDHYMELSSKIADELFFSLISKKQELIQNIHIAADDFLIQLPFGILTSSAKSESFATAEYLIRNYQFYYYHELDQIFNADNIFGNGKTLSISNTESTLKGNEVKTLDYAQTSGDFLTEASEYSLIHFSQPELTTNPSAIQFTNSSIAQSDLFQANLKADLIVFASNEHLPFEAQVELGQAAIELGADSYSVQLWPSSNDDFLQGFYSSAVSREKDISSTLNELQLKWISNNSLSDQMHAPFHWANQTIIGKRTKLNVKLELGQNPSGSQNLPSWPLIIGLLALLGLILFLFLRRK